MKIMKILNNWEALWRHITNEKQLFHLQFVKQIQDISVLADDICNDMLDT